MWIYDPDYDASGFINAGSDAYFGHVMISLSFLGGKGGCS